MYIVDAGNEINGSHLPLFPGLIECHEIVLLQWLHSSSCHSLDALQHLVEIVTFHLSKNRFQDLSGLFENQKEVPHDHIRYHHILALHLENRGWHFLNHPINRHFLL